ncbi:MAG: multidrug transporter ATPase [Frankiales bacterium]|nr:multidrug transporter ATPase [Frankiales bacterium]
MADSARDFQLPAADSMAVRKAATTLIGQNRAVFGATLILSLLATAAGLAGPWLLGRIIDSVQRGATTGHINELAAYIVVSAVLQLVLTRFAQYTAARFGERISAQVREGFLGAILELPASIAERVRSADVATRAASDVGSVAFTMRAAGPDLIIAATRTVFIMIAVLIASPILGGCAAVSVIGAWFVGRWYTGRARQAYLDVGTANSALAESLTSTAAGARTMQAFGLEATRLRESLHAIEQARSARMRALDLRTILFPVIDFSSTLPVIVVLLAGGLLFDHGALSVGTVVAAALYVRQLAGPAETLELWLDQVQSSAASFARLEGVHRLRPKSVSGHTPRTPLDNTLALHDVSYAYGDGPEVLHGITIDVRAGERLALVGPSGAGKSTVARLICGTDAPRHGTVTVGGIPVTDIAPEHRREHVVLVTQDHHIFLDTIRNNLLIAAPTATDAQLLAALTSIGATWIENLPSGLDGELGPRATALDTGQAQQLALARVLLANPRTVVLDEATALLDPATARSTERTLAALLTGRTVVAIAHRLHTARDADRIIMLRDGTIIENGSHEELISQGGEYEELWRAWHDGKADQD